jgi:hypothetical protein
VIVGLPLSVIVTPGINAPLGSETVPPNVAFVVCEIAKVEKTNSSNAAATNEIFIAFTPSPKVVRSKIPGNHTC